MKKTRHTTPQIIEKLHHSESFALLTFCYEIVSRDMREPLPGAAQTYSAPGRRRPLPKQMPRLHPGKGFR